VLAALAPSPDLGLPTIEVTNIERVEKINKNEYTNPRV
jgi:hypothetical protein